jgi:hypothetical protein
MAPRREDFGSWLEGTPGDGARTGDGPGTGKVSLGLPADGRGSKAPLGRRVLGLAADWAIASLISSAFFGYHPMATLGIFAVSTALLVSTLGFTVGHRVAGIQVVRVADVRTPARRAGAPPGAVAQTWFPPGLLLGTTRTVLLCLVIPAVVWDSTGRGLHDVAVGTVVVRR